MLHVLFGVLGVAGLVLFAFFLNIEVGTSYTRGRLPGAEGEAVGIAGCVTGLAGPLVTVGLIPVLGGFRWSIFLALPALPIALLACRSVAAALGSTRRASLRHARSADAITQSQGVEKLVAFHDPARNRDVRQALEKALDSRHPEVVSIAALALHALGQHGLVAEALARIFHDAERSMALASTVGEILQKLGPDAATPLLREFDAPGMPSAARLAVLQALGDLDGERIGKAFSKALDDPDPRVRAAAVDWTADHDPRGARDRILGALRDPDAEVRIAAIAGAQSWGDGDAILGLVHDPDPAVRRKSIEALAALGDPRVGPPAIEALRDGDPDLRLQAVQALGQVKAKEGVGPLLRILGEGEPALVPAAAVALGQIGDPRAIDRLKAVLSGGPTQFARKCAAGSLDTLGWKPQGADEEAAVALARENWEFAFQPDEATLEGFRTALLWEPSAPAALARLEKLLEKEAVRFPDSWLSKILELPPLFGPPPPRDYEPTPLDAEPLKRRAREEMARRGRKGA